MSDDGRMDVSDRISRWVVGQFREADAERVLSQLRDLPASVRGNQDPERIHAALVIRAGGDFQAFESTLRLAHQDWRDLLMAADLGHADWPRVLDEVLGTTGRPA